MKYLRITESNKWEWESWNFYISINDTSSEVLNYLISFCKRATYLSREIFKKMAEEQKKNYSVPFGLGFRPVSAVSYYSFLFADELPSKEEMKKSSYLQKNYILKKLSPRKLIGALNDLEKSEWKDRWYKGGLLSMQYK